MPRTLSLLLLAGLVVGCASADPPRLSAQVIESAATPPPGLLGAEPIVGEIGLDERHRYRLDLPSGRWVSIELSQREADLDLRLLDTEGREVALAATPGNWATEVVDLLTGDEGSYVVEIALAADAVRGGGYRLHLAADRPARPDDPARLSARREQRLVERAIASGEGVDAAERLRRLLAEPQIDWSPMEAARLYELLGDALCESRQWAEASAAYAAGLEVADPATAQRALLQLGAAFAARELKRPDEFAEHLRLAVEAARAAGDPDVLGRVLNSQAIFVYGQEDVTAARALLEEAIQAKRRAGDAPGEESLRRNLSMFLAAQGEREAAEAQQHEADRLATEGMIGRPGSRIMSLRNRAYLHRSESRFEEALRSMEEGLELALAERDLDWEIEMRLQLGALLNQLGDYLGARRALDRAAELATAAGADFHLGSIRAQLGWAALGDGRPDAAVDGLVEALALPRLRPDLRISLLHVLGITEIQTGQHVTALLRLNEAVDLAEGSGLRAPLPDLHLALGGLHLERGALDEAAGALETAAIAAEHADPLRRASAASLLARVQAHRGRTVEALELVLRAISLREEVRSRLVDPSLRASFFARWRSDFDLAIELLMRLAQNASDDPHTRRAFELSEAAHARTLTELLAEAQVDVRSGISPELLADESEAERRLSAAQAELAELVLAEEAQPQHVGEAEQRWKEARRRRDEVEREVRRRHPRYAEIRYPQPPSVEDVQSQMAHGTALLEYALGEHSSVLFVVTREKFAALPLPPVDEIAGRVAEVRKLIRGSALGSARLTHLLAELTVMLIAPAADLVATVDHLLIVPDRDLFYLPFEALGDPAKADFSPGAFLARWTVSYLPTASLLTDVEPWEAPRWELEALLLADPGGDAGDVTTATRAAPPGLISAVGLPPLPAARREAKRIAALFPDGQTELHVGREARESLLKARGGAPPTRRLHVASHGRISVTDPAASFLLLAADPEDDGFLQMHEIFNMKLPYELVVLSSCDTALGPRVDGEGLLGLSRAFLYAGARELVVSLWPVADVATESLMVDFYAQILLGRPTTEALREAKLAAIEAGASSFEWASFILFGKPQ
jgi:CHAT domain-containing protein